MNMHKFELSHLPSKFSKIIIINIEFGSGTNVTTIIITFITVIQVFIYDFIMQPDFKSWNNKMKKVKTNKRTILILIITLDY